jgi:hypothetical protein
VLRVNNLAAKSWFPAARKNAQFSSVYFKHSIFVKHVFQSFAAQLNTQGLADTFEYY